MIRRPPRSTLSSSSAASDVYKRQGVDTLIRPKTKEEEDEFVRKFLSGLERASLMATMAPSNRSYCPSSTAQNVIHVQLPAMFTKRQGTMNYTGQFFVLKFFGRL